MIKIEEIFKILSKDVRTITKDPNGDVFWWDLEGINLEYDYRVKSWCSNSGFFKCGYLGKLDIEEFKDLDPEKCIIFKDKTYSQVGKLGWFSGEMDDGNGNIDYLGKHRIMGVLTSYYPDEKYKYVMGDYLYFTNFVPATKDEIEKYF